MPASKWNDLDKLKMACEAWWKSNKNKTPTLHSLYSHLEITREVAYGWGRQDNFNEHYHTIKLYKSKIVARLTQLLVDKSLTKSRDHKFNPTGVIFYLKSIEKEFRQSYQDQEVKDEREGTDAGKVVINFGNDTEIQMSEDDSEVENG